jgi:hypothetical protein
MSYSSVNQPVLFFGSINQLNGFLQSAPDPSPFSFCPPTFVHTIDHTIDHTIGGHKVFRPLFLTIFLWPYVLFAYLYPDAGQSPWSALVFAPDDQSTAIGSCDLSAVKLSPPQRFHISFLGIQVQVDIHALIGICIDSSQPHIIITGHLNVPPLLYWHITICGQVWSKTNTLNW